MPSQWPLMAYQRPIIYHILGKVLFLHILGPALAYSLAGHGDAYSGYPPLGVCGIAPGGSCVGLPLPVMQAYSPYLSSGYRGPPPFGRVEPPEPYPNIANTVARGPGHPGRVEPLSGPYESYLNPIPTRDGYRGTYPSYSGSLLREDVTRDYMHDPIWRHDSGRSLGTPVEYMSSPGDAQAAYRPLEPPPEAPTNVHQGGSPYGLPSPRYS